jgi:peptide-methionine (S)-S-oxide reductase
VAFFGKYYPAETYHQNYFTENPFDQECSSIIAPKVSKIKKLFKKYFEEEEL